MIILYLNANPSLDHLTLSADAFLTALSSSVIKINGVPIAHKAKLANT